MMTEATLDRNTSMTGAALTKIYAKDFYLNMQMEIYEYMYINLHDIPNVTMKQYNLCDINNNHGYMLVQIRKSMYKLPQSGSLYHKCLVKHISKYSYSPYNYTNDLWKHKHHLINFDLVINDFGIKCRERACASSYCCTKIPLQCHV